VSDFQLEWDPAKNLSNQRKHGVSFEETAQLFRNPLFLSWKDRVQDGEERWQACGEVEGLSLLIVAHTIRYELEDGTVIEVIRIISARQAEPKERRRYETENVSIHFGHFAAADRGAARKFKGACGSPGQ
jgi:uncharacterized DUF497 family protein